MEMYARGKGHIDLAQLLGIERSHSLALGGSANSRIIRTTVKDSYTTTEPTLYVLGMTFISRNEIPILKPTDVENYIDDMSFEGRWTNPQNQFFEKLWEDHWTVKDTDAYVDLMHKAELYSLLDRTEDLMYRFLSLIADLRSRNHNCIIFNQADQSTTEPISNNQILLEAPKLKFLKEVKNFVHSLSWTAVQWQHSQGVPSTVPNNVVRKYGNTPDEMKHRLPGHHQKLNEYLINYLKDNKII